MLRFAPAIIVAVALFAGSAASCADDGRRSSTNAVVVDGLLVDPQAFFTALVAGSDPNDWVGVLGAIEPDLWDAGSASSATPAGTFGGACSCRPTRVPMRHRPPTIPKRCSSASGRSARAGLTSSTS